MSHDALSELAAGYALGTLEAEERAQFEAHLRSGCRECEAALLEYGESLATLAAELPATAPPPALKAALTARIGAGARPERPLYLASRRGAGWRWALAGGLVAGALIAAYLGATVAALNRELAQRLEEVARLRTQLARQQEILALVRAPETRIVALGGLTPSPRARGRMWWHPEAGGFFVADGLPAAPPGKTYQLWAIAGGRPLSAGVFDIDPKGSGALRVPSLSPIARVEMFAVTLEPAGGRPAPSGDMYLAGKLL